MPSAYVIVDMKISDPEQDKQHGAVRPASIRAVGGESLVRDDCSEVLEADRLPGRTAVRRRPGDDQAKACRDGERVRQARAPRVGAAFHLPMIPVEGVAAPV